MAQVEPSGRGQAPQCFFDQSAVPAVVAAGSAAGVPILSSMLFNQGALRWSQTQFDPPSGRIQPAAQFARFAKFSMVVGFVGILTGLAVGGLFLYQGLTDTRYQEQEAVAPRIAFGLVGSAIAGLFFLVDTFVVPAHLEGKPAFAAFGASTFGLVVALTLATCAYFDLNKKVG